MYRYNNSIIGEDIEEKINENVALKAESRNEFSTSKLLTLSKNLICSQIIITYRLLQYLV